MSCSDIFFSIKTVTYRNVLDHLLECAICFYPPLYTYVDIPEYAHKIVEKAVTFEAWSEGQLVGLIAAYFNDAKTKIGFITNVSVLEKYRNRGIAARLLEQAVEYGKNNYFRELKLELASSNLPALKLYEKYGFFISEHNDDNNLVMRYLYIYEDNE